MQISGIFTIPLLRTGCQELYNRAPGAGIGCHLSAKTCRGGAGTCRCGAGTCRGGAQIRRGGAGTRRGGAQIGRGGVQTEYPGRRICTPPLHVPASPLRVPAPPLRDFALRLRPIPASKNSLATYGLLLRCKTGATEKAPRKNKWGPRWFQGRHNSLLAIMFH